jgi:hypothetical protein
MKTIKTKPSGRTPRTLPDSARAPKELARKSLLEAHEKAKESIEQPQHNESPTEYAETRVEHAADDIAYRSTQAVGERGRQLTEKVKETQKQHRYERGTENARSSFSSENIVYQSEEAPADSQPARVSRSVQKAQSLVQPAPQESNAYRTGRERVRSSFAHKRRSESVRRQSAQEAGKTARTPKAMAKRTVKMLSNSEFIVMLNQAASDREKLSKLLSISSEQMSYITNADAGCGLIKYGSALVPFINRFPRQTRLYKLMTTKPGEETL